ncbi:MAG: hypothetical protein MJB14_09145, partial [Spirochaetes bacterium]|nr:hypothetical protein [Spirochaetota bacterium]
MNKKLILAVICVIIIIIFGYFRFKKNTTIHTLYAVDEQNVILIGSTLNNKKRIDQSYIMRKNNDGKTIWKLNYGKYSRDGYARYAESTKKYFNLIDNRLYLLFCGKSMTNKGYHHQLIIDYQTGKLLNEFQLENAGHRSHYFTSFSDRQRIYYYNTKLHQFRAVDVNTGKLVWKTDFKIYDKKRPVLTQKYLVIDNKKSI